MGVECERVLKGRVSKASDAAVAGCCVEAVARPVEDALVCLQDLLVFGEDAKSRSIDSDKEVILEDVSLCSIAWRRHL